MAGETIRGIFLAASSIVFLTTNRAGAGEDLVGGKVIAIRPGVVVRQAPAADAPPIDYATPAPIWTIGETNAGWLQGKDGWVRRADVVPLIQAVDFFTAEIARSPSAYAYAARSRAQLAKDELDAAAKDAETALRMDPDSCDALFAKASLLKDKGRTAEEADCYARIIKLDPRCKRIYYAHLSVVMKKKDLDGVLGIASAGVHQWPEEIHFRRISATWHLIRGSRRVTDADRVGGEQDYSNSIDDWSELLKQAPNAEWEKQCAQVYGYRAGLRIEAGRIDEAIADLGRSLELIPVDPRVWFERGVLRGGNNEHRLAIDDFNQAIQLGLKTALLYTAYGECLLELNLVDEALSKLNEAVNLDDRIARAYTLRGKAWFQKTFYCQAIVDFDNAIAIEPASAANYENRAAAWQWLREYDKAIEDCNAAIQLTPQSPHALALRAVSYANQREFEKAIADCDASIRLDASNGLAFKMRGSVMVQVGDYPRAIEDLTKAILLNSLDLDSIGNRAAAWFQIGEYDQAVADLNEYLRIWPQSPEAYRSRAEIYKAAGNLQKAAEDVRTAERIEAESRRR